MRRFNCVNTQRGCGADRDDGDARRDRRLTDWRAISAGRHGAASRARGRGGAGLARSNRVEKGRRVHGARMEGGRGRRPAGKRTEK